MPQGVGDMGGFDVVPFFVFGMRVVVLVEGRGRLRAPLAEAEGDAPERFAGAEERVRAGAVTDLFIAHRVLLVTKLEGRAGDAIHVG